MWIFGVDLEGKPLCMNAQSANVVWARSQGSQQAPRPPDTGRNLSRRQPPTLASLRDPILFVAGLAGIAHQTLIAPTPQWELLLIFGAMLGLPIPLRADEARRNGSNGS